MVQAAVVVADVEEVAPEDVAVAEVVDVVKLLDRKVLFFRSGNAEEQCLRYLLQGGVGKFPITMDFAVCWIFGVIWAVLERKIRMQCKTSFARNGKCVRIFASCPWFGY